MTIATVLASPADAVAEAVVPVVVLEQLVQRHSIAETVTRARMSILVPAELLLLAALAVRAMAAPETPVWPEPRAMAVLAQTVIMTLLVAAVVVATTVAAAAAVPTQAAVSQPAEVVADLATFLRAIAVHRLNSRCAIPAREWRSLE